MARATWTGAITFAGFPLPVQAFNFTPTSKSEIKTLCDCHGEPIAQKNTCATTSAILTDAQQVKGVEVSKGVYHRLDQTAVEGLTNAAAKTTALEIERVCPRATLDLHAMTGGYSIVPEPKKGAEKPVAILWHVLRKHDMAIVGRWTSRAGSRDSILAVYAGPKGLIGATLPHESQLSNAPVFAACDTAVADAEVAMFEGALTGMYPNGDYDAADFPSQFAARRQAVIDAAVAGQPIASSPATAAAPAAPDLMAALAASLQAATSKEVVSA